MTRRWTASWAAVKCELLVDEGDRCAVKGGAWRGMSIVMARGTAHAWTVYTVAPPSGIDARAQRARADCTEGEGGREAVHVHEETEADRGAVLLGGEQAVEGGVGAVGEEETAAEGRHPAE